MSNPNREYQYQEGILGNHLVSGTGERAGPFENVEMAADWLREKNKSLPCKEDSSFDDYYYLRAPVEQLRAMVCQERWWDDFVKFVNGEESSQEFEAHLDECVSCGKALDLKVNSQCMVFHALHFMIKGGKQHQPPPKQGGKQHQPPPKQDGFVRLVRFVYLLVVVPVLGWLLIEFVYAIGIVEGWW